MENSALEQVLDNSHAKICTHEACVPITHYPDNSLAGAVGPIQAAAAHSWGAFGGAGGLVVCVHAGATTSWRAHIFSLFAYPDVLGLVAEANLLIQR